MNTEYSDSLYPFGIGMSFVVTLTIMMVGGLLIGLFFEPNNDLEHSGGIVLLTIFLALVAGPHFYNKKVSRFEKDRTVVDKLDDIGIVKVSEGFFLDCFYTKTD